MSASQDRKGNSNPKAKFQSKFSLQVRLLIPILSLFVLVVGFITIYSYDQSKKTAVQLMEQRLEREVKYIYDTAQILMKTYVGDEDQFRKEIVRSIRSQDSELVKDGWNAEYYLITKNGIEPFGVHSESIPNMDSTLLEEINNKENGTINASIEGEMYTIAFFNIQEFKGIYTIMIPQSQFLKGIETTTQSNIIVSIVIILITAGLITFLVRNLTQPLRVLREAMRNVRTGNLNIDLHTKTTTPEIVSLITSFQDMLHKMRDLLFNISVTTTELNQSGSTLSSTSSEVLLQNEQLMSAIQVVKHGAEETATSSESNMNHFQTMKASLQSVFDMMNKVNQNALQMNEFAGHGEKSVGNLIETLKQFNRELEVVSQQVKNTKEHSIKITKVTTVIKDIAEKTKLLALNASIEAARAGEHGRGFIVIANDIRKLAEQSSLATTEIASTIQEMEDLSNQTSNEFEKMAQHFLTHTNQAEETREIFDRLLQSIDDISNVLQNVKTDLSEVDATFPLLEGSVETFASVSQETLASTEQMLHASHQQMEKIEMNHEASQILIELADQLNKLTEEYKYQK